MAALCVAASGAARASVLITIDKSSQHMTVAVDGVNRYSWPVSTGRSGYATPSGNYTPFRMEEDHYSKEWDDAPMPHSIFFTPKGHAIHGSYEVKRLGTAVSHGCVRLEPKNAQTLFALVKAEGMGNTKVVLSGQAPPLVARRGNASEPAGAAAGEPTELQQYRDPYGRQTSGYQQQYQQPQYQQPQQPQQPQYQQPQFGSPFGQRYAVQPQYGQPSAAQPRYPQYQQQVQQPYAQRDPRFDPRY